MTRAALAAAALAAAACGGEPAVRSCDDPLGGLWRSERGAYQILDRGDKLEVHPSFRDLPDELPPGVVAAPSVIDLARTPGPTLVRGTITRRYERGATFCAMKLPATLLRCDRDGLVLEVIDPQPPTDWAACLGPTALPRTVTLRR